MLDCTSSAPLIGKFVAPDQIKDTVLDPFLVHALLLVSFANPFQFGLDTIDLLLFEALLTDLCEPELKLFDLRARNGLQQSQDSLAGSIVMFAQPLVLRRLEFKLYHLLARYIKPFRSYPAFHVAPIIGGIFGDLESIDHIHDAIPILSLIEDLMDAIPPGRMREWKQFVTSDFNLLVLFRHVSHLSNNSGNLPELFSPT